MKNLPAFPVLIVDRPKELIQYNGMTLRDYFAAKALITRDFKVRPYDTVDETAKDCYRMADAMLKAREV